MAIFYVISFVLIIFGGCFSIYTITIESWKLVGMTLLVVAAGLLLFIGIFNKHNDVIIDYKSKEVIVNIKFNRKEKLCIPFDAIVDVYIYNLDQLKQDVKIKKYPKQTIVVERKYNKEFIPIDWFTKKDIVNAMYKVSRILKGLQFTTKYNIVRLWNDTIAGEASEENGSLIVSGIINPEEMELIHREQKLIAQAEKKSNKQLIENPKIEKTVISEEELAQKRFEKYKEKTAGFTQTIEVLEYNGSRLNSKYHCKLCGNTWEQRLDHFKGCGALHYVCPKCKR